MPPSPSLVVITASSKPLFAESNSTKQPITPPTATTAGYDLYTPIPTGGSSFSFNASPGLVNQSNTLTGADILEAEALVALIYR